MIGRTRHVSSGCHIRLSEDWSLCHVPAGSLTDPAALSQLDESTWLTGLQAGTVAAMLRSAGRWSLDDPTRRFDADDWWYRLRFDAAGGDFNALSFDGLAGIAEAWLNGAPLLTSSNMFTAQHCATGALRATGNELLIRFASLDHWLTQRRPRPRWRAPMIEQQQLRWARVSLLGHVPGWAPPAAPVGLWRGVDLVRAGAVRATSVRLQTQLDGHDGIVRLSAALEPPGAIAQLELERDGQTFRAELGPSGAELRIPNAARWWPHTHGEPALYAARLLVRSPGSDAVTRIELNDVGFRDLRVDTSNGDFAVQVNGVPVFCRGACWMPIDAVSLRSSPEACRAALTQFVDAGLNMVRVTGTTVYEEDHFHDLCDELGILVWQDFMFANMDYPHGDAGFSASVREELVQQLGRLQARPSLAVLCGNSEGEQQAAMWGSPRENWPQAAFDELAGTLVREWCPEATYWPSSAHGGTFPHQNDVGTTSYYGVGAYQRPMDDARRSGVRFATECLAFANVPAPSTIARMPGGAGLRVHHATWKARAPRDLGAGWDFDDIRDHYLQRLYGLDPFALRATDHERYLALSRAVSAEVMAATFAEWRRGASACRGALVWFMRDLWAGAGWGLVDDAGVPKAAYHGVKRACAPVAIALSDEGTNGLAVHVANDRAEAIHAEIEIALYRDDGLCLQHTARRHAVAGRSAPAWNAGDWFDGFIDVSRAYRFGPAEHALIVASLRAGGQTLGQAFHFPEGLPSRREREIGLQATAQVDADGNLVVELATRGFAQSVYFDVPGFIAQDEHFHLAPGATRQVLLRPDGSGAPARGSAHALNAWAASTIKVGA